MALVVVWDRAAVTRRTVDNKGVVVKTEEVVLNRGEALPDYVSDFDRSVMVMIGAVRDLQQAVAVVQAEVDRVEAGMGEQPPPPVLPSEIPPVQPTGDAPGAVEPVPVVTEPSTENVARPKNTANKDAWEDYVVAMDYLSRPEAETYTKTRLIELADTYENVA